MRQGRNRCATVRAQLRGVRVEQLQAVPGSDGACRMVLRGEDNVTVQVLSRD
jgi:hypothetical protein